jgi:hypothetical protein
VFGEIHLSLANDRLQLKNYVACDLWLEVLLQIFLVFKLLEPKITGFNKQLMLCLTIASSYLSVRPFVRMEPLGSHWKDFHEIWYMSSFRKSVENIPVSLNYEKNNGYFT